MWGGDVPSLARGAMAGINKWGAPSESASAPSRRTGALLGRDGQGPRDARAIAASVATGRCERAQLLCTTAARDRRRAAEAIRVGVGEAPGPPPSLASNEHALGARVGSHRSQLALRPPPIAALLAATLGSAAAAALGVAAVALMDDGPPPIKRIPPGAPLYPEGVILVQFRDR